MDVYEMKMFTAPKVARTKGFNRCKCDISNVGGICENVRRSNSWDGSKILPLVRTKLDFQTLVVIGKKIGFKAIPN